MCLLELSGCLSQQLGYLLQLLACLLVAKSAILCQRVEKSVCHTLYMIKVK